jgi:hypothetical protein
MSVPARPASGAPIDSVWGGVVHDTAVAMDIQSGQVTCVHTSQQASPQVAITFPRPFAAPPMLALGCTNFNYGAGLAAPASAAGASVATWRYSGATSGSIVVQWIAYGPRA